MSTKSVALGIVATEASGAAGRLDSITGSAFHNSARSPTALVREGSSECVARAFRNVIGDPGAKFRRWVAKEERFSSRKDLHDKERRKTEGYGSARPLTYANKTALA